MFFQLTKTSSFCPTLTLRNAWQCKRSVHTGLGLCVVAADQHGWFVASVDSTAVSFVTSLRIVRIVASARSHYYYCYKIIL